MNNDLLKFIQKNNIIPMKYYFFENDKLKVKYTLMNGSYDSELITEKAKKELNMDLEKLAYESYCLLNIKYSQENEFFID